MKVEEVSSALWVLVGHSSPTLDAGSGRIVGMDSGRVRRHSGAIPLTHRL